MPYAANNGVRIRYEVEGDGPPLMLQYGQYFPLEVWRELNYVAALKKDCRLILMDARGHGDSDKPYDPEAYAIEHMVNDVVAVLDDLGIEKANYMGYSSGGLLGFGLARFSPHRFHSLIIGGTHPYPEEESDFVWRREQIQELQKQTPQDFVAGLESYMMSINLPTLSPQMKSRMLMTHDLQALIAWLGRPRHPDFVGILGAIPLPCLIYAGDNDSCHALAQQAAGAMSDATFVSIPNGEHLEGGTWVNILAPHIRALVTRATPT